MELFVCPVRLFTPELEGWLSLFRLTHVVRVGQGRAHWERTAWPSAGGLGDQLARTVEALDWIRRVWDVVLAEQIAAARSSEPDQGGRAE